MTREMPFWLYTHWPLTQSKVAITTVPVGFIGPPWLMLNCNKKVIGKKQMRNACMKVIPPFTAVHVTTMCWQPLPSVVIPEAVYKK